MKREARNFPIQSPASDLTLLASMAVHKSLPKDIMIVNLVHDSIIIEAPNVKSIVMPLLHNMKTVMEEIPQKELNPEFSFPAEFSVGTSWGNMKDIDVA
jgi:DNA polymerase I-like protein with 3'-5' exonuclease and polymerase domains